MNDPYSPSVAQRIRDLPRAGIRIIFDEAQKYPDAIHLEIGQPDFPTPAPICDAAAAAMRAGETRYTPNPGTLALRADIAQAVHRDHQVTITPDEIVVTTGGMGALATGIEAILNPGDEILLPDPGWPNYAMQVICAGGTPTYYDLDARQGYQPDPAQIAQRITPRTRAILVNSPSNPTGGILTHPIVEEILALAEKHNLLIISDEVYDRIVFDNTFTSFLRAENRDRVIYINSFSKTYAMTGWRIGYLIAPRAIASEVAKLQEVYCACACSVSQAAARAALRLPQSQVKEMVQRYDTRRTVLTSILTAGGVPHFQPRGTFFLMADISGTRLDSQDFALQLLHEQKVAVAPGQTFGRNARQNIRLAFAVRDDLLATAGQRLVEFIAKHTH
ncbi:MAG: Aspartate aminotransferase [Verrucomicrobiae bacterium]|nr:Aspartate aminotransferase [Verrucomicrobiae bacterium]